MSFECSEIGCKQTAVTLSGPSLCSDHSAYYKRRNAQQKPLSPTKPKPPLPEEEVTPPDESFTTFCHVLICIGIIGYTMFYLITKGTSGNKSYISSSPTL